MTMKLSQIALLLTMFVLPVFGQNEEEIQDSVEVILIEAFISPEKPSQMVISFFTSEPVRSKLVFDSGEIFVVTDSLLDNHKASFDISSLRPDTTFLKFTVLVEKEDGISNHSEVFEVELPRKELTELARDNTALTGCLIGGAVYLVPGFVHHYESGKSYAGFNKEFPVISFFRGGYNYPIAYLAAEYSHIPKMARKNFYSVNANLILETKYIEYISAGAGYLTDFGNIRSVNLDVSVGLFKLFNVFTVYAKTRLGFPTGSGNSFSQQSIGLFSSFFSIQI